MPSTYPTTRFARLAWASRKGIISASTAIAIGTALLALFPVRKLLTNGETNTKVAKGTKVRTFLLSLVPSTFLGKAFNACPWASIGCALACLFTAGRGRMRNVAEGRIRKGWFLAIDRTACLAMLRREIANKIRFAKGALVAFRLNVVSDHPFEVWLADCMQNPSIAIFYDYTKSIVRYRRFLSGNCPPAYYLTFSLSETNRVDAVDVLRDGGTVAVPFNVSDPIDFPDTFLGHPVWNGETTDYRVDDPKSHVIGLTAKGMAKHDTTGFVVDAVKDPDCKCLAWHCKGK